VDVVAHGDSRAEHNPPAMTIAAINLGIDLVRTDPEPGRESAFVLLLAFLCSFGFIRTSARLTRSVSWWPGGVQTEGGVHLHHLVWGIVLLLVCGFTAFATELESPWWQITSVGFGVGAGFALDEFALWVRLQDVYWSEEGRASLDAVIMATVFAGLVVIGVQPWGLDETSSIVGTAGWVLVTLALAGVSFMKGRLFVGLVTLFVPLVGLWGALRLSKPNAPFAKKRYGTAKLARSRERFRTDRRSVVFGRDLLNAIGGAPSEPDPPADHQPPAEPADHRKSEP
jgi:hypothetical protein